MADDWTIRRVVAWTAKDFEDRGIDSPRLDAELLVAHALGVSRVSLYLDLDRPLGVDELGAIRALVARRRRREPVAYILGQREFYGRSFRCGPGTLVPRPETETLVTVALEALDGGGGDRVLDLCTGTGAVGLTLLAERATIRGDLTDLSEAALETTRRNAAALEVEARLRLHRGDLFQAVRDRSRYPLVVANPPYVPDRDLEGLMPEVSGHEPRLALAGGDDGLDVVRRILDEAGRWLTPGGTLLVEIGDGQADEVAALAEALPADRRLAFVTVRPDLGGTPRVAQLRGTVTDEEVAAEEAARTAETLGAASDEVSEGDSGSEDRPAG